MSARNGLRGRLVLMGLSAQAADRAIDAHAHELAEEQRADAFLIENEDDCCRKYGLALARSIDPEVLNSE